MDILAARNFDALVEPILRRYFAHSELAHTWSALAQVCRAWSKIIARFDLAVLTPRQLYYDAAAVSRHNIAPPYSVWQLIPHNVVAVVDGHNHTSVDVQKLPRLGWPSGAEALTALARKWGPHPGWIQQSGLWLINGAIDAMRVHLLYAAPLDRKWDLCLTTGNRNNWRNETCLSPEHLADIRSFYQKVILGYNIALPGESAPCQSHLVFVMSRYMNGHDNIDPPQLRKVIDLLERPAFNLIVQRAVIGDAAREFRCSQIDLVDLLAESNNARPRYEPLYFVPPRKKMYLALLLARMVPAPPHSAYVEPHPYDIHVPAMCDECRALAAY